MADGCYPSYVRASTLAELQVTLQRVLACFAARDFEKCA